MVKSRASAEYCGCLCALLRPVYVWHRAGKYREDEEAGSAGRGESRHLYCDYSHRHYVRYLPAVFRRADFWPVSWTANASRGVYIRRLRQTRVL